MWGRQAAAVQCCAVLCLEACVCEEAGSPAKAFGCPSALSGLCPLALRHLLRLEQCHYFSASWDAWV